VGDPVLESDKPRRVDFALFMIEALQNDELVHEAPAIVGCKTPSALAFPAAVGGVCLQRAKGTILDFRMRLARVTSGISWTRLVAAMSSSAGSLEKSSSQERWQTSRSRGQR